MLFVLAILGACLCAPAGAQQETRTQYDLTVSIEPALKRMAIHGRMRIARQPFPRDSLSFLLWSRADSLVVELESAGEPGRSRLQSDSADGDRRWTLRFLQPVPADSEIVVRFSYVLRNVDSPQIRVATDHAYAGGGGEIWYPTLAFDSLGVGTLRFTLPATWRVIAPGARQRGDSVAFAIESGSRFGFAAGQYTIRRARGNPAIELYLLRPRSNVDSTLTRAGATLADLQHRFGPLDLPQYAIAEVRFGGSVAGTSEFGFFLADQDQIDRALPLPFVAHEIGHAWWGNRVGTRPGPGRMMLTEGLASFGMLRAIAAAEGVDAARSYRAGSYPSSALATSAEEYFRMAAAGLEIPLTAFAPQGQKQLLTMHRMANTRGMFVYDMLAREIGESVFANALRTIAGKYKGGSIDWSTFRRELEVATRRDLAWFFEQWTQRTGAPEFALEWKQDGGWIVGAVTQTLPSFRATLELVARDSTGRSLRDVVPVDGARTAFRFRVPFHARDVTLDPDNLVLRWTPELRARAVTLAAYTWADWERRFGNRAVARDSLRAILTRLPQPDTLGVEAMAGLSLARALLDSGDTDGALSTGLRAAAAPRRPPQLLPQIYLLLARVYKQRGDLDAMRHAIEQAITADAMIGGAAGAIQAAASIVSSER
jgi:hypothetical protein